MTTGRAPHSPETPASTQAQSPMLRLLERLLATGLSQNSPGARSPLRSVRLVHDGLLLEMAMPESLPAWVPGMTGTHTLHLRIEHTASTETRFRLHLPDAPGVGRFVDWGLKNLPDAWLNEVLGKIFMGALHKRGDLMVLDHQALLQALSPD